MCKFFLNFVVPQAWARTPLWKRAEYLHKVDGLMKANAQPMADALVKEVRQKGDNCMQPQCDYLGGALHTPRLASCSFGQERGLALTLPLRPQVAKGAKDSLTEVIRSGDLISYTAEEGVRWLGEVQLLLQGPLDVNDACTCDDLCPLRIYDQILSNM